MALNANYILAGQQVDPVGAIGRGAQVGQQVNEFRNTNALRQMYRERGADILRGDENALAALAQFSPQEALGVQTARLGQDRTRLDMQATQQRMNMLSREEQRQVEAHAASISAAERAAEVARIEQAVAAGLQAQTPQQWDAMMQETAPDLVGQFDNREVIAGRFMSVAESLKRFDEINAGPEAVDLRVGAQEILEDGTIIQSTNQGPIVFNPLGERVVGQAAADAIAAANAARVANETAVYGGRRTGTLQADIDLGGEAAGTEKLAELSMDAGVQAFTDISKVNSSLSNISEAIAAIDDGAASGLVYNMLPNVTEASASLNNAMNRMGLDVISAVTFGALSEAEMQLAMETAVPRNLRPAELRSWLTRKREAQEKARDALTAAAQYLTTPGNTINSWLQQQESGSGDGAASDEPDFSTMSVDEIEAWLAENGG